MSKNPVIHFEMPYEDKKRLADFYTKAFGWEMNILGKDMGNYVLAQTTETDKNQMVQTPGTINGGFFERTKDKLDQYPSVVIGVEDIEKVRLDVEAAGGMVLGEPMQIPGIGKYVSFRDSEGNRVGLMQAVNE